MKDFNYPLRKAYTAALDGNLSFDGNDVPVYYQQAPDTETIALYVVLSGHANNGNGTMHTQETSSTFTVNIHSFGLKYSNGQAVDNVAGQILEILLPSPQAVLDLSGDGLQMTGMALASDNVQDFSDQGGKIYIDRILTFRHQIFNK